MYFIRLLDIAIHVTESRKLSRNGTSINIMELGEEPEKEFKTLCTKSPYANCKRLDYFDSEKRHIVPSYIWAIINKQPMVLLRIQTEERNKKIDELLKPEQ